jgi:tetratricopeptide (TPR) repeat protein
VQLLQLIKESQTEFRLSLDEIVKIFVAANYDPIQIRSELQGRNSAAPREEATPSDGHRQLAADEVIAMLQPAPPPGWLNDLRRRNLVNGDGERYAKGTVELIRSIWNLCQIGVELNDLDEVVKRITDQAEAEVSEFRRVVRPKRHQKTDYAAAVRSFNAFGSFVNYRRAEALNAAFFRKVSRFVDTVVGPNQKRIVPSETFLVKMGLNREIDRLLHQLDRKPEDKRSLRDLARAYHLRSDWLNLYGVSEKILQLDPADTRSLADQTRAMYYLGRIDEAVTKLEARLASSSDPLLKFRLGQSLVLRAKGRGIRDFFNAIMSKQVLTAEALHEARDQPSVRRWIMLDRALDDLSVSDPLQLNPLAIEDLEELYEEYQSISDRQSSPLSKMNLAVGKILAAYALHLAYRRQQSPKAEQLRRKIVQIDPHSVLAKRSKDKRA